MITKTQKKVLGLSLLFAILVWVLNAYINSEAFQNFSFLELLITKIPPHGLHVQILISVVFIVFGLIVSNLLTKQNIARKKLETSQKKYKNIFNSFIDLYYEADENGIIQVFSPSCYVLLGFSQEEMIGKNVIELYSNPKDRVEFLRLLEDDGVVNDYEITLVNKHGEEIKTSVNSRVLIDENGKMTGVLGTLRNITERKKAEEEILKHLENLEIKNQLVEEKSLEVNLINEKLYESEEKLRELNSTKDKFFSIIAHDLKNPISSFSSALDLLTNCYDEISEEEILELIVAMNSSSKHLYELLENLLEWSRSQTGSIPFNPENYDLHYTSDSVIYLCKMIAKTKNIKLISEVKDNTFVIADSNMISTIIRNLVTNAIKFTPENGQIIINAIETGDFIEISIADSGVGMSEESIEKLFRIDTQHTTLGTNSEKGTGLGLILCKEFVEKNGGKIWVESELGKGSTLKFTLPKGKNSN